MATENLSADRLRELLHYDPETGDFTWRVRRSVRANPGTRAGYVSSLGYVLISVDSVMHNAHRLAWLYFYGSWPKFTIDHFDGVRNNNRIANLRDVPIAVNSENILAPRSDNQTGQRGVSWDARRQKFVVQVNHAGRRRFMKRFDTLAAATVAYEEAKRRLHPESRAASAPS